MVEKSAFLEGDIVFSETDLTFNVSTKHRSLFDNIVLKTSKVS
jgi:hypothetical protein